MAKDVTHTLENETAPNELGAPAYELLENTRTQSLTGRAMPQT